MLGRHSEVEEGEGEGERWVVSARDKTYGEVREGESVLEPRVDAQNMLLLVFTAMHWYIAYSDCISPFFSLA